MSSSEVELNTDSISKMKVAELKKELKARGLSTTGAKNELQERLQQALQGVAQDLVSEDGNAESEILDEDEVLGGEEEGGEFDDEEADAVLADEPKTEPVVAVPPVPVATKRPAPLANEPSKEVQPKKRILVRPMSIGKENGGQEKIATEQSEQEKKEAEDKKVIKLTGVGVKERLEMRTQKFGIPLSEEAKKEFRAARFGVPVAKSSINIITTKIGTKTKINFEAPSMEVLKKRAARFGCNVSSVAAKLEQQEKLKKRQERFGVTTPAETSTVPTPTAAKEATSTETSKTPITMSDMEEKKKLRATLSDMEEKKKLRAERFKI